MYTPLLIDGDLLLYKAAHASQSTMYGVWESEEHCDDGASPFASFRLVREANDLVDREGGFVSPIVTPKPEEEARHTFRSCTNAVVDGVREYVGELSDVLFCISCPRRSNFRSKLPSYLPYKGNRTAPEPYHLRMLRDYSVEQYVVLREESLEADDILGLESSVHDYPIMASIDKDLLTIPGRHYNWNKGTMTTITGEQALHNFYVQLYQGDSSDNVLGVPGIGPKKAERALTELVSEDEMHFQVFCGYVNYINQKRGREALSENSNLAAKWLNQNANLLWIQRAGRKEWGRDAHTFNL